MGRFHNFLVFESDLESIPPQRLYLLGFMGAGKSTVGLKLSNLLDWPFVDLDDRISRECNQSIPKIFDDKGEDYFRTLETRHLEEMASEDPPIVVATGGGVPVNSNNREIMENTGFPILLRVSPDVAYNRIKGDSDRPKLDDFESFKTLWSTRQEAYNSISYSVQVDNRSPDEITNEILEILKWEHSYNETN